MIMADDLGYQDVGFRGSNIRTPNIDRLAREGVILENHYVMSVCAPTRASLMTGRHAIRTGFWKSNLNTVEKFGLGLDETLLPEMLKRNGYSTHGVGKWHCGAYSWEHTPAKRGFDTFFGSFLGSQNYFTHRDAIHHWLDLREDYHDTEGNFVDKITEDLDGLYNTYLFTNRSVELIRNHDKTRPFFLYLAYTAPHEPVAAPSEDIYRFASNSMRNSRKTYATMVSIMDDGVGKVADALKELGMMDNTILVFTSDNGARFSSQGSNFPLRGGKGSFLEGGVRGVAFINSPLLQKTGYINTNIYHVTDWYATFQKLANDNPDENDKMQLPIDGVNIWSSISENKPGREEVLLNLSDSSKYLDTSDSASAVVKKEFGGKSFKTSDVEFKKEISYGADEFFALRWKNWKLIAGPHFKLEGWSSENHQEGFLSLYGDQGKNYVSDSASGTVLFDLSTDIREEKNLAGQRPDIVKKLLDKKQGYAEKLVFRKRRIFADISMKNDIFRPWVEDTD